MPTPSRRHRPRAIFVSLGLAMALCTAGAIARLGAAKPAPNPAKAAGGKDVSMADDLQRSVRLDTYRLVADGGAARGENIYFYKCWMCHNQYTKGAPLLKDLFQHETLTSGDAVNDDNVTAKIKEGGPGMPAFRTSLSDADIADLRAYFHSGKCCVEGENPPANPWYRAETQKWPVQNSLTGGATGMVRRIEARSSSAGETPGPSAPRARTVVPPGASRRASYRSTPPRGTRAIQRGALK